MKKTLCALLALCLMLTLLPFGALAADASGEYGDGLRWTLTADGTLTITGRGAMPDYTQEELFMDEHIDQKAPVPWQAYDADLRAIVIGEGITRVGDYTFMNCRDVASVTLPSTLRSIGKYAFSYCAAEAVTLPNGLQEIGDWAYAGAKLRQIVVPASVTKLGTGAYQGCDFAKVIKVLGPVEKLESHTFYHCRPTDLFLSKDIRSTARDVFQIDAHVTHVYCDGGKARFLDNIKNLDAFHYVYLHTNTPLDIHPTFTDVPDGAWYADSVQWAAERSFTSGTSETTFSPEAICTRAQMVTFLWRFCGSPKMTNAANPFDDVHESDYFYQAVLWAVENNITNGTSGHTFSPEKTVTRAETVTFFWRKHAREVPNGSVKKFRDVPRNAYYADAVDWAVYTELTNGISADLFGPDQPCTRAQIVTFLNRYTPRWWG
ncbi:MAG: S-layer homology domain-containing protein [Oscillospiraceae bacterium]|nr:S-layer homology domain-containing protein [Oscillospiraceae bacterium]